MCPATASPLRENSVLTELRLLNCDTDAKGISQLADALRENTTLEVLQLSEHPVGPQGAGDFGKLNGGIWGYGLVTSYGVSVLHPTRRRLLSNLATNSCFWCISATYFAQSYN